MKKIVLFFFILTSSLVFYSCSFTQKSKPLAKGSIACVCGCIEACFCEADCICKCNEAE